MIAVPASPGKPPLLVVACDENPIKKVFASRNTAKMLDRRSDS